MKDSYVFYKDKLHGEYKVVFEQVEMYVITKNIDSNAVEERLGDLLDIFLSSQEAEKPVQKIVGTDPEQFCRAFCSDLGMKNRILNILDTFKTIAWLCFLVSGFDVLYLVFDAMETGILDIWHSTGSINIVMYLVVNLIAVILFMGTNSVIHRIMFRKKQISMKVFRTINWVEAGVSCIIIFLSVTVEDAGRFECPVWILLILSTAYLVLYYLLRGRHIRREKIRFSELMEKDVKNEFDSVMEKQFEKVRKKQWKKGKGELSLEEFIENEEKSCERAEKLKLFYILLPPAVTVLTYIFTYLNDGFETYMDAVIFVVIILAVEYAVLLGLWKIVKSGIKTRRAWVKMKQKELEQGKNEEICE